MNILITGAAGFIGSHLAIRLLEQGHKVRGIDSLDSFYSVALKENSFKMLSALGAAMTVLDLTEDELSTVLEEIEVVFHLAAQPGNDPLTTFGSYFRNNLLATQRLLDGLNRSTTLRSFINVSTSSVYGFYATENEEAVPKPASIYGVTKLAAEQLVFARQRVMDFPACSLRLYSVYGERDRPDKLYPKLIKAINENTAFPLFKGSMDHKRSYTYVSDIIDGMIAVVDKWDQAKGEIFNLGNSAAISTGEGLRTIEEIMNKKVNIEELPHRPGDQLATCADITKARNLLNYEPKVSPREGLERMVAWYQKEIVGKIDY